MIHHLIVGRDRFTLDWNPKGVEGPGLLTVTDNRTRMWQLELAGWRALSVGYSGTTAYLWSAREVIVLPTGSTELMTLKVDDDDVVSVYAVQALWILVCETSVRMFIDGMPVSRMEFGEVLMSSRWDDETLLVTDVNGVEYPIPWSPV